jgi:hypothetical protein
LKAISFINLRPYNTKKTGKRANPLRLMKREIGPIFLKGADEKFNEFLLFSNDENIRRL